MSNFLKAFTTVLLLFAGGFGGAAQPPQQPAAPHRVLGRMDFMNSEASGLAAISGEVLGRIAPGATEGWWIVSDEAKTEPSWLLAAVHTGATWRAIPVEVALKPVGPSAGKNGDEMKIDDAEAAFRDGDTVVFVGSHFGSKKGPMDAKRAWMGRLLEKDLRVLPDGRISGVVEVARNEFELNAAVNLALEKLAMRHPLIPATPHDIEAYGPQHPDLKKRHAERLGAGAARPINIEGAALVADELWLGLRFPVTAAGEPIIVRLRGWRQQFSASPVPLVADAAAAIQGVGRPDAPRGIRDLAVVPGAARALTFLAGNLDTPTDKHADPVILKDRPNASKADTQAYHLELPAVPPATNSGVTVLTIQATALPPMPSGGDDYNPEGVAHHGPSGELRIVHDRSRQSIRIDAHPAR